MQTDASPSTPPPRREWSWENPPEDAPDFGELECVAEGAPFGRDVLATLGLEGLQFAEWKSLHPACLDSDFVGLRHGGTFTAQRKIYTVGGDSYFVQLDARDPLPFDDQVFAFVYAEHFVEHITLDEGIRWLSEVRRVLEPGGVLRVTTPDLALYVASYLDPAGGFFAQHRDTLYARGARPAMPDRRAFMMNLVFQHWGHRWIYDFDELRYALIAAGFSDGGIERVNFGEGRRPDVASFDRPHRRHETMYVEAVA